MWGTQIVEDKFKADDKGIKPCTRMGMKKPLATLFFHKHGLYDKKKKNLNYQPYGQFPQILWSNGKFDKKW